MLNIEETSNVDVIGKYMFKVSQSNITAPGKRVQPHTQQVSDYGDKLLRLSSAKLYIYIYLFWRRISLYICTIYIKV